MVLNFHFNVLHSEWATTACCLLVPLLLGEKDIIYVMDKVRVRYEKLCLNIVYWLINSLNAVVSKAMVTNQSSDRPISSLLGRCWNKASPSN